MKLSDKTVGILKNFSSLSTQFLFRPGNNLRAAPSTNEIVARAHVEETFERVSGIHDLPKFIGVLSLFSEPELEFGDKFVTIASGRQKINFTLTPEEMIKAPPDRDLNPERVVSFKLPKVEIDRALKATSVLGHTEIAIVGAGGILTIEGLKIKDPTSNTYRLDIGETSNTFRQIMNKDILKLLPRDYDVSVTRNNCIEFVAEDITYWIGTNMKSEMGDL